MKNSILYIVLMVMTISTLQAQNTDYIDVKKGKNLKEVRIHEVNKAYLVYEKHGSLHDILVEEINYYIKDNKYFYLEANTKAVDTTQKVTAKDNQTIVTNKIEKQDTATLSTIESNTILFVKPLGMIDLFSGVKLGAGIQFKLSEDKYFKQHVAYVAGQRINNTHPELSFREGIETRSELKFITSTKVKPNRNKQNYVSAEYGFKRIWGVYNSYQYQENISIHGSTATVNMFNVKYGQHHIHKSKFFFDWYVGFGINSKALPDAEVSYWYNEELEEKSTNDNGGDFTSYVVKGRKATPKIAAGVDIGIAF